MRAKAGEALALALGAGAVVGGECRGFIKEEQVRIQSWRHYRVLRASEFQCADNPLSTLVLAHGMILVVVEATAIAHERAERGRGYS